MVYDQINEGLQAANIQR